MNSSLANDSLVKVHVVVHRESLIVYTVNPESLDENWVPYNLDQGGSRFGCVLINCKDRLFISKQAIKFLGNLTRGYDAIGDVDWFSSVKGDCFSWFGPPRKIIAKDAVTARGFQIRQSYNEIKNTIPDEWIEYFNLSNERILHV